MPNNEKKSSTQLNPDNVNPKEVGNTRNSGKRSYPKGKSNKKGLQPKRNDWKFYAASDQLAKDAASIPYNYVSGGKFGVSGTAGQTVITNKTSVPAVMVIPYVSSIGVAEGKADGVNNAAMQFYSMVRKANSGAKNYEAPDLMMYVLALRDIYSLMAYGKQILGLSSRFDVMNVNTPDLILRALGIDPVDLRANIAQYRKSFNELVCKVNVFAMPEIFSVFARSVYIHSAVFMDSTSMRAQYYVFRKMGYHKWDGTTNPRGTQLTYQKPIFNPGYAFTGHTFTEVILTPLQDMVNAIYFDTDAQTMNGDILKTFQNTSLLQFVQVDENYQTPFTVDEDILAQIENSHTINKYISKWDDSSFSLNITQSNQLIYYNPTFFSSDYAANDRGFQMSRLALNSHKDNPDYTDNLEWTRLMCVPTYSAPSDQGVTTINFESTGLEIPTGYEVWYYSTNSDVTCLRFGSVIGGANAVIDDYYKLAAISNFDWHPIIYVTNKSSILRVFADLKLCTIVDAGIVSAINNTAVFGAFYSTIDVSKSL